jgi:hypothetical protein
MTDRDHDLTPTADPGPVPASVRRAWAQVARPVRPADEAALEAALAVVADPDADEDARLAAIETVLAHQGGAEALAILAAARGAVPGTLAADQAHAAEQAPAQGAAVQGAAAPAAPALGVVRGEAPRRVAPTAPAPRRPLPRWALAAAMLAVVAGVGVVLGPRGTATGEGDATRDGESAITLVGPRGDFAAAPTRITWRPRPGRPRYTVEVLDASDAPVLLSETTDTSVAIPRGALKPGAYRWFVRARGADGAEVRSALERFTIR